MTPQSEHEKSHFGQLAVQYYTAGRWAAINQFMPVSGTLLHHAVEMALKAALITSQTMPELKGLGHDLSRSWAEFKRLFADPALSEFDSAVGELDKFEEVRYPDSVIARGAMMELALFRDPPGGVGLANLWSRRTCLCLKTSTLARLLIFEKANINPRLYTGGMLPEAKQFLFFENRHAEAW